MAIVDVVTEITIDRALDTVAAYAADPDNAPEWYVNIKAVDWQTQHPLSIGSRIAFVANFLGRRLEYTYEIVAFFPGECLTMRTAEGPFPMETTYEWTPLSDSQTRMRLRNRGQPSGLSALTAPFMSWMVRRANQKDLALLKQILESSSSSDSNPQAV